MPDDPVDWVMRWLWPGADSSTRRAYRSGLLEVQGGAGVGGGNGGVAADAGPAEDAGVAGQTKGGSGMSDDQEARRLAVEAAARALATNWRSSSWVPGQMDALAAAVRRLDAPRYQRSTTLVMEVNPDGGSISIAQCWNTEQAQIIVDALNAAADAEGR